jgi:hypothetical protein
MKLNNSELPSESRTKPKSATLDIVSVPIPLRFDHLQRLKNCFGPKTAPSGLTKTIHFLYKIQKRIQTKLIKPEQ